MDEISLLNYKKNQSIRRLAHSCAHNYNNVFAGLTGQIGMALREDDDTRKAERRQLIDKLVHRGTVLTELLYRFTSPRTPEWRHHSPGVIGEKATILLNAISNRHEFELIREVDRTKKFYGNADDILLLLFYLGENSLEAMPEGGKAELHLDIREKADQTFVSFTMTDRGTGIPEELREKAFDPFVTSKEDVTCKGLGLFAAKKIALSHGGHIAILPESDGGASVGIDLPAAAETATADTSGGKKVGTVSQVGSDGGKKQFLIVDDEPSVRSWLGQYLRRRGHGVLTAANCSEALELYRNEQKTHGKIDYILLDLCLDDLTGADCAGKLLEISSAARLIFMSGGDNRKEREGFSDFPFLRKPFSLEDIEYLIGHDCTTCS